MPEAKEKAAVFGDVPSPPRLLVFRMMEDRDCRRFEANDELVHTSWCTFTASQSVTRVTVRATRDMRDMRVARMTWRVCGSISIS